MHKKLGVVLFLGFVLAQAFASFSQKNLYPLNPYRMFSKNWYSGIEIAGISVGLDENSTSKAWKYLRVPFFQTNKILMDVFYGESTNNTLKEKVCLYLAYKMKLSSLEIFGEMDKYSLVDGEIYHSYAFRERAFKCQL